MLFIVEILKITGPKTTDREQLALYDVEAADPIQARDRGLGRYKLENPDADFDAVYGRAAPAGTPVRCPHCDETMFRTVRIDGWPMGENPPRLEQDGAGVFIKCPASGCHRRVDMVQIDTAPGNPSLFQVKR